MIIMSGVKVSCIHVRDRFQNAGFLLLVEEGARMIAFGGSALAGAALV